MKILIDRDELVRIFKSHRAFYCDEKPESFRELDYSDKCRVDMLDSCISDVFNMPKYKSLSEELEKIKAEIQGLIDFEESCCDNTILGYECLDVIDKHISELKGENDE